MSDLYHWTNTPERKELWARAKELLKRDRSKYNAIKDILEMADDEVESGESPSNEYELAMSSLNTIEKEIEKKEAK